MKILVVAHWGFKSLHGGNLRTYFILKELSKRNEDLTILLSNESQIFHTKKIFPNCKIINTNLDLKRSDKWQIKIIKYIKFVFISWFKIFKSDCDAVLGINLLQIFSASLTFKRKYFIFVDIWANFFEYNSKKTIVNKLLYKIVKISESFCADRADKIITITNAMKREFPKYLQSKFFVIPDGADLNKFSSIRKNKNKYFLFKYKIDNKKFIFNYTGGISKHEGLDYLILAAKELIKKNNQVLFLIVGDGEYLSDCRELVRSLNLNKYFIFTGWVDYSLIENVLDISDCVIVPMPKVKASNPIISFKLLESLAAGKLIVASNTDGIQEVVDSKSCIIAEIMNKRDFATKLNLATEMSSLKKNKMINQGKKIISKLDWRDIAIRDINYFIG